MQTVPKTTNIQKCNKIVQKLRRKSSHYYQFDANMGDKKSKIDNFTITK